MKQPLLFFLSKDSRREQGPSFVDDEDNEENEDVVEDDEDEEVENDEHILHWWDAAEDC